MGVAPLQDFLDNIASPHSVGCMASPSCPLFWREVVGEQVSCSEQAEVTLLWNFTVRAVEVLEEQAVEASWLHAVVVGEVRW